MAKYTGVYLNQDEGNKWTASYWIAAVSKWVHYTILGDKDGNLIDSAHPLDVKAAANSGVDIGDVDVLSSALPTGAATSAKQDTLAGLVGEVQESPTENTVLERLKALETELTDIKSTSGIKGITDTVNVAVTGSLTSLHTFQDAIVAAADGAAFTVLGYKTLTVYISGTSTSRTIEFKALPPGAAAGDYRSLMGVRLSDFATSTSTTSSNEVWQFDITGLTEVLMDCSAVAGGNVTVKGRAVA